jgi:hypothetical protein
LSRVSFASLLREASELSAELGDRLEALVRSGQHTAAAGLVAELSAKLPTYSEEQGNEDSRKFGSSVGFGSAQEHVRTAKSGVTDTGLSARDIDDRFKRQRHLRAQMLSDVLLIFFAMNQFGGVTSEDANRELARLGLTEPIGTIRSRASRLKSDGLLDRYAPFGRYRLTQEGHRLAYFPSAME